MTNNQLAIQDKTPIALTNDMHGPLSAFTHIRLFLIPKPQLTCMDHHKQQPTTNPTHSNKSTFSSINLLNIQTQQLNKVYINPIHNRQKILGWGFVTVQKLEHHKCNLKLQ